MTARRLQRTVPGQSTSDGAGVRLKRSIGADQVRVDPFLMLDEFASDDAADYIAGFPSHPHRGFETVTYMLEGEMLHEDHLGNRGRLTSGSVQWMTAARGIIHSEMPQQEEGRMHGFQLWINLPAAEKMNDAAYRDIPPEDIPDVDLPGGGTVKVIAGRLRHRGEPVAGAVSGISTDPTYLDVRLNAGEQLEQPVSPGYSAFIYVYQGAVRVLDPERGEADAVSAGHAGVLGDGDRAVIEGGPDGAFLLFLAARPLNEPVVQYGPFVMNTEAEIRQALQDYRDGTLTR